MPGRPRTTRPWKLALRREREMRVRGKLRRTTDIDHMLINAIREMLGFEPLYSERGSR